MKTCSKCGETKELSEFSKNAKGKYGVRANCKVCQSIVRKEYHKTHRTEAKINKEEWIKANPEKWSGIRKVLQARRYRDPVAGPKIRARSAAWKKANPELRAEQSRRQRINPVTRPRVLARIKANAAVQVGKLARRPCEICGSTERVEKHHDDYTKPLNVRWLCKQHHMELHNVR
jgi:hypothetical protein